MPSRTPTSGVAERALRDRCAPLDLTEADVAFGRLRDDALVCEVDGDGPVGRTQARLPRDLTRSMCRRSSS
jgi:hypothetical protein